MEVRATHAAARISPRKVRTYRGVLRGLKVDEALAQLRFLPGKAAQLLYKVLASAAANALHNHDLRREDLVVADVVIDGGFTLPRFRPVSRGRAHGFRKRTAHISIVVEPVVAGLTQPAEAGTSKNKKSQKK